MLPVRMFLRSNKRIKDGKEHRYYTVVESRRLRSGKVAQRQVLYLGEINDSQQVGWRKTLEVFDEEEDRYTPLSLFPEDRPVPSDAIDSVQVKLHEMKLERARPYGNCWLGCELWRQLQLDRFWTEKLPQGREQVAWAQVLELLVVNRLIDPGSEFRLHRQWFDQSAMDVLLGRILRSRKKTGCTAAWITCWNISKICSCTCSSAGKICSMRNSMCCCTT